MRGCRPRGCGVGVAVFAAALVAPCPSEARNPPTVALLSPSAGRVVAQQGDAIHGWSREGKLLAKAKSTSPIRGALADNGALLGVFSGKLAVLRGQKLKRRVPLKLPKGISTVLVTALSAEGRIAAALYARDGGAGDATAVSFYDARGGRLLGRVLTTRKGERFLGASLSADGRRAALFGDIGRRVAVVQVFDLRGRRPKRLLRWQSAADKTVFSATLSAAGDRLAVGAGQRLVLLAVPSGKVLQARSTAATLALFPPQLRRLVPRFPGAHQLAFSRDGKVLAVFHAFGVNGVARWEVSSLKPKRWLPRPQSAGLPRQLAFSRDGRLWLVTAGRGGVVELFEGQGRAFRRRRRLDPGR